MPKKPQGGFFLTHTVCGTTRLGGQVCRREVWLPVQTVSCDDERLEPASSRNETC